MGKIEVGKTYIIKDYGWGCAEDDVGKPLKVEEIDTLNNLFRMAQVDGFDYSTMSLRLGGTSISLLPKCVIKTFGEEPEEYIMNTDENTEEVVDTIPTVTGGSSPSYYRKSLSLPLSDDRTTFVQVDLEAGDVSDAWDLGANQFNVMKSTLRGDNKEGVDIKYALDKQLWFTLREKMRMGLITHKVFWEQAEALGLTK